MCISHGLPVKGVANGLGAAGDPGFLLFVAWPEFEDTTRRITFRPDSFPSVDGPLLPRLVDRSISLFFI